MQGYYTNIHMELRILELFAAFCLFLSIIRPLVRGLWKLDGLVVCPLLAFGVILGIFPAYGFRPECIPLLLFALFLTLVNLSDLIALFSGLHSDIYRDRGMGFIVVAGVLFICTLWLTLYYAPTMDLELSVGEGIETLSIRDRDGELHVRIYGAAGDATETVEGTPPAAATETVGEIAAGTPVGTVTGTAAEALGPLAGTVGEAAMGEVLITENVAQIRPLLIFLPPVAGSLTVTEGVCLALRDRGFTVLAYSRPGFDSPAFDRDGQPMRLHFSGLFRLISASTRGLKDTGANAKGRELEEGRRRDTELLLREIAQNRTLQDKLGPGRSTVFLAGYGAGGAALAFLTGEDDFAERYPQVKGIITVEAPLLGSLEGDIPLPPAPLPDDSADALFRQIKDFFVQLLPKKITRIDTIPRPVLPALFIVSDKVIQDRSSRYETVLRSLAASRNMALLAAVPGAGPFDYSDSPRYFPVLSVLFRGASYKKGRAAGPEITAALITNFAVLVLSGHPDESLLETTPLRGDIYLETGGVWNIPNSRAILHQ